MNPGQIAYEAYCRHTDWKSLISGDRLPPWNSLRLDVQRAWDVAAEAVLTSQAELTMKARSEFERHVESGRQAKDHS